MSDLNLFVCTGRLTKSAELKYLQSGSCLCNFSIACNQTFKNEMGEWEKRPDYFDCVIWGKYGESMVKHLSKGSLVTVSGRLKQDRWEKDGVKQFRYNVVVSDLSLLPTGKKDLNTSSPAESFDNEPIVHNESAEETANADGAAFDLF